MKRRYSKEDIERIWKGYLTNTCSQEERELLEKWHLNELAKDGFQLNEEDIKPVLNRFFKDNYQEKPHKLSVSKRWIAAACIALLVGASVLFFYQYIVIRQNKDLLSAVGSPSLDVYKMDQSITPGMDKAVLKLANGNILSLEDLKTDESQTIDDIKIIRNTDGSISYELLPSGDQKKPFHFNEIITPRGGQFQVVLPDGTKVWLNAMTRLRVSSNTTNRRQVELVGEAYFEVQKDPVNPFIVKVRNHDVVVRGTHFNVHAYEDANNTKTTLLEGSIEIVKSHNGTLEKNVLQPGQEAIIGADPKGNVAIKKADGENAIAWKKGYFSFENNTLPDLMKQLEKWYDIHVVYEDSIKEHAYVGQIARKENLLDVLKIMNLSGLSIRVVERTVYISEQ